jgi:hypothetical protein
MRHSQQSFENRDTEAVFQRDIKMLCIKETAHARSVCAERYLKLTRTLNRPFWPLHHGKTNFCWKATPSGIDRTRETWNIWKKVTRDGKVWSDSLFVYTDLGHQYDTRHEGFMLARKLLDDSIIFALKALLYLRQSIKQPKRCENLRRLKFLRISLSIYCVFSKNTLSARVARVLFGLLITKCNRQRQSQGLERIHLFYANVSVGSGNCKAETLRLTDMTAAELKMSPRWTKCACHKR